MRQHDLGFSVDYKKLALLTQRLAEKHISNGIQRQITMSQTVAVGTVPVNVAPADEGIANRLKQFVSILRSFPCFEVHSLPLDYHGYHLRSENREKSDDPNERNFVPAEKGVDSTLVVRMMELQHRDKAMDVACVLSGDQDFIPAIKSLQASGCLVFAVGINNHLTMGSSFNKENIRFVDLVDYRNDIERTSNIDPTVQNSINELTQEIEMLMEELPNWNNERILCQLNLWAARARLLDEKVGEERSDDFRGIFGMLSHISREYHPGFAPALKRSYQGKWEHQIEMHEVALQRIVKGTYSQSLISV